MMEQGEGEQVVFHFELPTALYHLVYPVYVLSSSITGQGISQQNYK